MIEKKQKSVRRFLLISIMAVLLSVSLVSGVISWLNTQEELDELYDQNLRQMADIIDAQHAVMNHNKVYALIEKEKKITGEEDYFVRIRDVRGSVIYISHPSISLEKPFKLGFSEFNQNNKRWKMFVKKSAIDRDYIDIAQVVHFRTTTIGEITYSLLIPQLLSIPLLGFLIWLIVGRGLEPLNTLSNSIISRKASVLTPISLDEAPIEIQPLVLALNDLLSRLGTMITVLQQFTANAAHELRTPLTALKLQLAALENASDPEEQKQAVENLKAGIERSIFLVQQLLTLARTESDSVENNFQPISMMDAVKNSLSQFIQQASEKKVDLGMAQTSDSFIVGDKDMMKVLINNLIDNAIRYTPVGGVVDVNLTKNDNAVTLEVADSGPGIPPEEYELVLDRFYRGKHTTTYGTGLGLSIVKEIVVRHQGTILIAKSERLGGLSIKIVLPNSVGCLSE